MPKYTFNIQVRINTDELSWFAATLAAYDAEDSFNGINMELQP